MTNDDTLRTALTKLADATRVRVEEYARGGHWIGAHVHSLVEQELRALLAAHPAPETDSHVCTVHCDEGHYPAPVSDTRREDVARADPRWRDLYFNDIRHAYAAAGPGDYVQRAAHFDVVMAPPVVDEAEIADVIREAFNIQIDVGTWARRESFFVTTARAIAARLRGATRG